LKTGFPFEFPDKPKIFSLMKDFIFCIEINFRISEIRTATRNTGGNFLEFEYLENIFNL